MDVRRVLVHMLQPLVAMRVRVFTDERRIVAHRRLRRSGWWQRQREHLLLAVADRGDVDDRIGREACAGGLEAHLARALAIVLAPAAFISHQYDEAPLKTGVSREVPVHPVLAQLLEEWRELGFRQAFGRNPTPGDFIAPNRDFNCRTADAADDDFLDDLAKIGLRRRRGHDSRRTFTTIAQIDGARRDILKVITHAPSTDDIVGVYTSFPWPVLCQQVACIKTPRPTGSRRRRPTSPKSRRRLGRL